MSVQFVDTRPVPATMIGGLKSVKLLEQLPYVAPVATCTTLVLPPAVLHAISMSLPCWTMDVIWNGVEPAWVGSVPARYSCRLLNPSPSASSLPRLRSNGSRPCSCFQPFGMPSPTALRVGSSTRLPMIIVPPLWTNERQAFG